MFRPYWVILRQCISWKELLLHCFASSRWIVINTSYFAPRLRPLYVVGGETLVLLCVRLVLIWKLTVLPWRASSSETFVSIHETIQRYIQEDNHLSVDSRLTRGELSGGFIYKLDWCIQHLCERFFFLNECVQNEGNFIFRSNMCFEALKGFVWFFLFNV
jgi:hypothetical protein